jgi:protein tyrosine phosphatase (PTP) superfamily phosphohydrolase (DUF442 family)
VACSAEGRASIPKFCIATPDVLWAGGRPDTNDASWLIQQGIKTVVDLELLHNDKAAFGNATVDPSKTYTLGYFQVRDWEPLPMVAPSVEDDRVAQVLAITTREPAPVFVHCRCGMKRTALMVAAHRVVIEGRTAESAIHEMTRYGGAWSGPDTRYILSLSKRREEMQRRVAEWVVKLKRDALVTCTNGRCAVSNQ